MKVAVLTLTRDRLEYTKHCFATLHKNAGCYFAHFVGDQGSTDETWEWLRDYGKSGRVGGGWVANFGENIGICRGANRLVRRALIGQPDVIVRFDNDCEVVTSNTLKACAETALEYDVIVAPHVRKLRQPPPIIGKAQAGSHTISETAVLGGIFMAIPASLFTDHGWRYDERMPPWTGDEQIVPWWRAQGGTAGYLDGFEVNHYERVAEQADVLPDYQLRKELELAAA